jgi:hypothetical protein
MRVVAGGCQRRPLSRSAAISATGSASGEWSGPWSARRSGYSRAPTLTLGSRATSLHVALREYAPELLVLAGPGASLASIVGSVVVTEGYRGLRSRAAFESAQQSSQPLVLSMGRGA